jgi:hypothetical protein
MSVEMVLAMWGSSGLRLRYSASDFFSLVFLGIFPHLYFLFGVGVLVCEPVAAAVADFPSE